MAGSGNICLKKGRKEDDEDEDDKEGAAHRDLLPWQVQMCVRTLCLLPCKLAVQPNFLGTWVTPLIPLIKPH